MNENPKWHFRKISSIIVIFCSALIIILAVLQLFGVWENAALVYMPLTCVNMLFFAASNWKTHRGVAVFNLIAAVFVLLCIAAVLFLK